MLSAVLRRVQGPTRLAGTLRKRECSWKLTIRRSLKRVALECLPCRNTLRARCTISRLHMKTMTSVMGGLRVVRAIGAYLIVLMALACPVCGLLETTSRKLSLHMTRYEVGLEATTPASHHLVRLESQRAQGRGHRTGPACSTRRRSTTRRASCGWSAPAQTAKSVLCRRASTSTYSANAAAVPR